MCKGGVRLTKYKGSETEVTVPGTYKGQPVVELEWTFFIMKPSKGYAEPFLQVPKK